ncbi:hypothetical protein [Candidatus Nitrososphaera gargensis]|uniref:hypothetical protein n=1 Tax=Candidatus Nitrososphaera gargensis TaxID=497727 RepID=UPI0011E50009|nr:hypothetical protein [Candidatus Nitrososphaera gargensis]
MQDNSHAWGIVRVANSMKHFSVQVTCNDGSQYWIPAYRDEAEGLYKAAMESVLYKKAISILASR